jgi:hypothetical protein
MQGKPAATHFVVLGGKELPLRQSSREMIFH